MDWKILSIITPLAFAIYQSISKLLPKTISVYLVNAYAFFIGFIFMLILHFLLSPNKSLSLSAKTLPIVFGIGILLALGNFGIIKAFSLGAPQSLFSIMCYITLLVYGVIFGVLLWHETLNLPQILGALLSVAGVIIIFYFKK
jgi:drug/metabolite transporter (DMT)-like permease